MSPRRLSSHSNACRTSTLPIGLSPRPRESLWEKFTTNIFDPLIMHVKTVRSLFMGVLVYLRKWTIAQIKCNSDRVKWPKKSTKCFETQHCGVSWNFSICLIRPTPPTLFCPLTHANDLHLCWGDYEEWVRKLSPLGGLPAWLWRPQTCGVVFSIEKPLLSPSHSFLDLLLLVYGCSGLLVLLGQKQYTMLRWSCSLDSVSKSINSPCINHSSNKPHGCSSGPERQPQR